MSVKNSKLISGAGLVAVGLICGFLLSLGTFLAPASGSDLLAAARGLSGEGSIFPDGVAAALWQAGGAAALAWSRWSVTFLSAWAIVCTVLWFANLLAPRIRAALQVAVVLVSVGVAIPAVVHWETVRLNARLSLPLDLMKSLPSNRGEIYTNPSARQSMILYGKAIGLRPPPVEASAACRSPTAWRAAMRERGWSVVLLAGPVTEYRPLLEHLRNSPDWKLGFIANSGWVFFREPGPDAPLPSAESIDLGSSRETAIYLAQLSERYEAMQETPQARAAIERAMELAPRDPTVLLYSARFAAARRKWGDVVSRCDAALRAGSKDPGVHGLSAHARLESGDPAAARESATAALRMSPQDLDTLFLMARIFRAENDFGGEARVLEKAVSVAQGAGIPEAGFLVFLGQSYARAGNAPGAIKSYRAALASGQLGSEQSEAVREALELVEARSPQ